MYAILWLTFWMGIVGVGAGVVSIFSYLQCKAEERNIGTLNEDLLLPKVLLAGAIFLLLLARVTT